MAKKPPARARTTKPAKGGSAGGGKSPKSAVKPAGKVPAKGPVKAPAKATAKTPAKVQPKTAQKAPEKGAGKPSVKGAGASGKAAPKAGPKGSSKVDAKAPIKSPVKAPAKAPATAPVKGPTAVTKPVEAAPKKPSGKVAPAGTKADAPASPGKPVVKAGGSVKAEAGSKPAGKGAASKAAPATGGAAAAVPVAGAGGAAVAPADAAGDGKGGRKGITIVNNKPRRSGPRQEKIQIPKMEPLLGPGSPLRKPLIASGPGAVRQTLEIDPESLAKLKSPFGKKDLQRFRDILLKKRADLVGDVSDLESEALLGRSGSLSALPQHIAEQGSETYEQSLSLNLAAEDRRLIREIDAALQRIDKGTFGICEMTGKAISRDRLEELPWTRFSIEAARESERRSLGGR